MGNINIYLAGACKCLEDEGMGWRKDITEKLNKVAEWKNSSVTIFDPTEYFPYSTNQRKSHKQVKEFFMNRISKCDLVLVNLDDSDKSVGTGQETQAAVMQSIPVIGFGTKNIYPWISEVDCQVIFNSMHEAIDYVRDFYMV